MSIENDKKQATVDNRYRYIVPTVAVIGTIFLLVWFLFVKQQNSFMVLIYCLAPLIVYLIINFAFKLTYRKRKD